MNVSNKKKTLFFYFIIFLMLFMVLHLVFHHHEEDGDCIICIASAYILRLVLIKDLFFVLFTFFILCNTSFIISLIFKGIINKKDSKKVNKRKIRANNKEIIIDKKQNTLISLKVLLRN